MFPNRSSLQERGISAGMCSAYKLCLLLCFIFFVQSGFAQTKDTADKVRITILNSGKYIFTKTDSGDYTKFVQDVILLQGSDTLYCDSVYLNNTTRNFEAFNNVRIAQQGGTQGSSDYLKYTTAQKLAFMRGNVSLTDGKNKLWCEELTYDLGTKTGVYSKGGTLNSDSTTVSSRAGTYNVKTKEARFTDNVIVTDPRYRIKSKDLGYNTETKVETFYGYSVVISDSSKLVLTTTGGTYDSKNVIAHFRGHSSIWNADQYIEADTMSYNKATGYGFALGNVISIDTTQHSTLYCGYAEYYRRQRILWACIKPVMVQVNGKDTLYMRADTFYSAPMMKVYGAKKVALIPKDSLSVEDTAQHIVKDSVQLVKDTIGIPEVMPYKRDTALPVASPVVIADTPKVADNETTAKIKGKKKSKKKRKQEAKIAAAIVKEIKPALADTNITWVVATAKYRMADFAADTLRVNKLRKNGQLTAADTAGADTTAPMFFIGYHHVLIFSDSLQGKCDSVCYTRSDSLIRMIYAPIAWAHNSQITGDTILMQLDSSSINRMYVPNNALLVSQSGPEQAHLYDQIQGKTLNAFFKNNEIVKMVVRPNAESIYYSKDEAGAYLGVDQAKSEIMRVFFENQQIQQIKFEVEPHHTMTPLEKADLPNTKLSRFKWLMDLRPKNKEELFK